MTRTPDTVDGLMVRNVFGTGRTRTVAGDRGAARPADQNDMP
jgi:hypothetical protein